MQREATMLLPTTHSLKTEPRKQDQTPEQSQPVLTTQLQQASVSHAASPTPFTPAWNANRSQVRLQIKANTQHEAVLTGSQNPSPTLPTRNYL